MWNIFFKDLKERILTFFFCLIFPSIVPIISTLFFKNFKEDLNSILILTLYFIFLPFYLSLSSSNLLLKENLNLIKNLPISYNKIVFSKILFLFFNFLVPTTIYLLYSLKYSNLVFIEGSLIFFVLNFFILFILSFSSFSFTNLLKNIKAGIFLSFLLSYLNLFVFFKIIKETSFYVLACYDFYFPHISLILFSLFFSLYSSKMLLNNRKNKFLKNFLIFFIFLIPAIFIFLKKEGWIKEKIISESSAYPIYENKILLQNSSDVYLYDLDKKELLWLQDFSNFYITQIEKDKFYFIFPKFLNRNFCGEKKSLALYYKQELKRDKKEKLGLFPYLSYFFEDFVFHHIFLEKLGKNLYEFIIKDIKNNNCFKDTCQRFVLLKDGIFYKKFEENLFNFYYVEYKNFEKKKIFTGDFELSSFFFWERKNVNFAFLSSKEKKMFKIYLPSGEIFELGKYSYLCHLKGDSFLAKKKEARKTKIYLFEKEKAIKEFEFPYSDIWIFKFLNNEKYLRGSLVDKEPKRCVIEVEKNNIKIYPLKSNILNFEFLKREDQILIHKLIKIPFYEQEIIKTYLYNFKKGKEKSL